MVDSIQLLHVGQKTLVPAAAAQVAQEQSAVEATVDEVPVFLAGGRAVERGLVGLGAELRAVHDVLLLDADAAGDGAVRRLERLEQLQSQGNKKATRSKTSQRGVGVTKVGVTRYTRKRLD